MKSDAAGRFTATFAAPDDFGFQHDIVLQQGDRLLTQDAFNVDMTVKLLSDRGPPGSPIEVEVHGYGYRELEDSWVLLYDNRYTGWMLAATTAGSARVTIPATGGVGRHVLEVIHSDFTFPYRNKQQSPSPDGRSSSSSTPSRRDPRCCRRAGDTGAGPCRPAPEPGELSRCRASQASASR